MQVHDIQDGGDWLSFDLPLGEHPVPVRILRETMVEHFDANAFKSLAEAYRHHAEQIHLRVAPLVHSGTTYTAAHPLVVRARDLS